MIMELPTENAFREDHSVSPPATADSKTQHGPPRVRRRNRQINSCLECRRRKLKCDKGSPCANCTKIARPCVFIASGLDADAQKRLAEVKEKMGVLERSLEEDVARLSRPTSGHTFRHRRLNTLPGQEESHSDQEDDEDTRDLNLSSFVTEDAAYYDDDANNDDDILDLGIAIGKMRITERIGGLVRPRLAEEFAMALRALPPRENARPEPIAEHDPQDWLAPSRDYVAPASSFFFTPGVEKTTLMAYLPSKFMVDKLISHYWEAVHVVARTVHRPSFERHLDKFWADVSAGIEPRNSFQAVFFAALLASIVSMHEVRVLAEFGVDKQSLVNNFRQGTEAALSRANFLRTTKFETLQAFVMYLVAICRGEVSRGHSALTGTVIRLAECMSLHRDPTSYSSSAVEIQVRRLVWHQICFLDLRTSESTGPRIQIRHGDYDTRLPLNIDDEDLDRAANGESWVDVSKDRSHFTTVTITRMRFECYEMQRFILSERPKLEQKRADGTRKITLVSLLSRIHSFKAAMEKTYLPMLSKSVPLHALASEIYGILSDRLYIQLLQKYLTSDRSKLPGRLRQLVMSSAVTALEHSMVIEQQPALSTWSWYIGAIQQYHPALLLVNELYTAHNEPEVEARIWRCMDFAFGLEPGGSNVEKFRFILEELVKKSSMYTSMKRVRAPTNMPHAGPRTLTKGSEAKHDEAKEWNRSPQPNLSRSNTNTAAQQPSPPPQTQHYQQHAARTQTLSFPGAVPNVDWGTIDLPAQLSDLQPHFPNPEPYNFGHYAPSTNAGSPAPTSTSLSQNRRQESDTSSASAVMFHGGSAHSSPMDALNDIDWNEIEKMFGGPDTGSGMMIPPFSFPQFEPGNLDI